MSVTSQMYSNFKLMFLELVFTCRTFQRGLELHKNKPTLLKMCFTNYSAMRGIFLKNTPIKVSREKKSRYAGGYKWFLGISENPLKFLGENEHPNILEPHNRGLWFPSLKRRDLGSPFLTASEVILRQVSQIHTGEIPSFSTGPLAWVLHVAYYPW